MFGTFWKTTAWIQILISAPGAPDTWANPLWKFLYHICFVSGIAEPTAHLHCHFTGSCCHLSFSNLLPTRPPITPHNCESESVYPRIHLWARGHVVDRVCPCAEASYVSVRMCECSWICVKIVFSCISLGSFTVTWEVSYAASKRSSGLSNVWDKVNV